MDTGLPDISGYTVAQQIRAREQENAPHVPIVALTAHLTQIIQEQSCDVGIAEVISKPLSEAQAMHILQRHVLNKYSLA